MKKLTGIAAVTIMGITMASASLSVGAAESTGSEAAAVEMTFDTAVEAALNDAGLTEDAVTLYKKTNDYENGLEIYEIDFLIPGENKYDYKISADTGEVIEKEVEPWEAEDEAEFKALLDEPVNYFDFYSNEASAVISTSMMNALEEMAPADETKVLYYKSGMEYDNGMVLYEIGLMLPGEVKNDYKFDAKTGDLFNVEKEPWEADDDNEYAALMKKSAELAAMYAAQEETAPGEVTEESAKAIALKDAGYTEIEVTLKKCAKDIDDGLEKFDVEFVAPDGMEYNYEISAADGSILEKESEFE